MKPHRRRRHRRVIRFKTRSSIIGEISRERLRRQNPGVIAAAVAGRRATWRNNRR
jgi:hypothetical protein